MITGTSTAPATSAPAAGSGYLRGMLWLTWRQHRGAILVGTAVTLALLGWMMVTSAQLQSALSMCAGQGLKCPGSTVDAAAAKVAPLDSYALAQLNIVTFLPLLLGMFWGAPVLSREYDQRTLMLAWSQDVTPMRWLAAKVGILGLLVAALSAALAGEAEHLAYFEHIASRRSLFEATLFQAGGWMPLTLGLAWFAFGVAAGAGARRTLPALALVCAAFIGRVALMTKLRPHFMAPLTQVQNYFATDGTPPDPLHPFVSNDMSLNPGGNVQFLDAAGHVRPSAQVLITWCSPNTPGPPTTPFLKQCFHDHHIVGVLNTFQPASRMGTFHAIENAANLGLLLVSLVAAWWFVRRASEAV